MTKRLLEIAADIVQAQASVNHMSPDAMEQALAKTFITLQRMKMAEENGSLLDLTRAFEELGSDEKSHDRLEPKDSIQNDKVICMECGSEMRQLTSKHLSSHGLTPREYKKKYGFSLKQPLSAKSLTKARSKAAKKRGLPENLVKFLEERRQKKADLAPPEPTSMEPGQDAPQGERVVRRRGRKKKV